MSSSDDDTPSDQVKKAMARKRKVTDAPIEVRRGKTTLKVHEGGKPAGTKTPRKPRAKKDDVHFSSLNGGAENEHDERPDSDFSSGQDGQPPREIPPEDRERALKCRDLDQNDRDNARRLIIWYGPDIVYVSGMGWLTWRGSHWQRDEGDLGARLLAAADAVGLKKLEDWTPTEHALVKKAAGAREKLSQKRSKRHTFAVSTGNAAKTSAMLTQAASLKSCAAEKLDANLKQFNVRNGTLLFERVENDESDPESPTYHWRCRLTPHTREDMITKCAEVDYVEGAACPEFEKFLVTAQPPEIMRLFLQVMHGYALLVGGNDEQRLVFHYGTGANGKSAFMEAIGRLAGPYRAVVSPDTITGDVQRDGSKANSDIARLHSTRLATIEELPRGSPLKEGLIKALTGGTRMVARFLQKEIFEFDPIFTAILSGNDMPTVSGTDYGIWRRLLIVHWAVTIAEADRIPFGELMKMFDAERSGILNWLVAGALRYLNEGLAPFIPAAVTSFTDEYREERDPVGSFVEACVLRGPDFEHLKVGASEMYKAYTEWCEANAIKPYQQTAFGLRLNALGIKKKRGHKVYYLGVYLVPGGSSTATPPEPGDPGWSP